MSQSPELGDYSESGAAGRGPLEQVLLALRWEGAKRTRPSKARPGARCQLASCLHSHFRHLIPHFSSRSPCISGPLWRLQPPSHPSSASSLPTFLALSVFSVKISKEPDFWPRGPDHVIALPVPAPGRSGWRAVGSGGTEYGHPRLRLSGRAVAWKTQ